MSLEEGFSACNQALRVWDENEADVNIACSCTLSFFTSLSGVINVYAMVKKANKESKVDHQCYNYGERLKTISRV